MKFLSFIYILFSSINSHAVINQTFYFDNSVQRGTSQVTNLSIKGLPDVPAKSFIVSSKEKRLPKFKLSKTWKAFDKNREWYISKGQKCRCRDEVKSVKVKANFFKAEHTVDYLGDYRGEHLFKITIPLIRLEKEKQFYIEKLELRSNDINEFSLGESNDDRKIVIILPNEFLLVKLDIKKYYEKRFSEVIFIDDKRIIENRRNLTNKLKEIYQQTKMANVLFVGNSNFVPTFYVDTKFDSVTPSDYPYVKFGGEGDLIPDVISARWSVENTEQIKGFIFKLKNKATRDNPISLGVSSNEGYNPSDREYVDSIIGSISKGKNIFHLNQDDMNSNSGKFLEYLNSGLDFFNYVGHGSGFSWPSFGKEVSVLELEEWLPGNINPIVVDVACQNGKFNGRGYIGETMISGHQKYDFKNGAAAYIGGSVDISWDPPAIFAQGISAAIEENLHLEIGQAMFKGFFHLMEMHHDVEDLVDHFEWTHLQGDPTASIK